MSVTALALSAALVVTTLATFSPQPEAAVGSRAPARPQPSKPVAAAPSAAPVAASPAPCPANPAPRAAAADELLHDVYLFPSHTGVTLPRDLRWDEDPFRDRNWRFHFHSLTWTEPLWSEWQRTADATYRDRYVEILRDWVLDNPRANPPSDFSWNDHSTALRGMVFACALMRIVPAPAWLRSTASQNGRALASQIFYVGRGNHALDQSLGLLELGCTYPSASWRDLAQRRIESLVRSSVDAQGVSNEQSEGYHLYNFAQYTLAIERLRACGLRPSRELVDRVSRMPRFAAFAATPGGRASMIGDTGDIAIPAFHGTETEYVVSGGATGLHPPADWATYDAGYAFFRSGWGKERPLAEETSVTVRCGPARAFHGHYDGGALTLAAYGDRILLDSGGPYDYNHSAWNSYFVSEQAHNTVTVDGLTLGPTSATKLVGQMHTDALDFVALRRSGYAGVAHDRRVFYSRGLNVLVVEDHLTATRSRTFRQLWHLHPDANPVWEGAAGFATSRPNGPNVAVLQLADRTAGRFVTGARSPIQGWVTLGYGRRTAAPVAEFVGEGRDVHFVTVIVPSGKVRRDAAVVRYLPRAHGFELVLRVGERIERITFLGTTAESLPLGDRLS